MQHVGGLVRTLIRWAVGLIVIVHGLIHLLGAVKGFGWGDVGQLTEPISTSMGVAWLIAAIAVIAAGVMLLAGLRWWWLVAAIAAVLSQAVIVTSWTDAKAGTAANVLLGLAALYGFCANGPTSFRARSRRLADEAVHSVLAAPGASGSLVTESDLAHLPVPVADYVRASGALGRPHVVGFHAVINGRIRAAADAPWMRWTGEQTNTFGVEPSRVFYMDATMKGLPTDVLHAYVGPSATMQVRVASLKTIIEARGPDMDQAETVTLLNDLCVLAPAALVDAPIEWTTIDDHHVGVTFTNAGHTVSAVLTFNEKHELVDFVSHDRLAAVGRRPLLRTQNLVDTDHRLPRLRRTAPRLGRPRPVAPRRCAQLRLPRVPRREHPLPRARRRRSQRRRHP
jgi:uncharacterized membrane protein YphA (DoxX/SURF4 family)